MTPPGERWAALASDVEAKTARAPSAAVPRSISPTPVSVSLPIRTDTGPATFRLRHHRRSTGEKSRTVFPRRAY